MSVKQIFISKRTEPKGRIPLNANPSGNAPAGSGLGTAQTDDTFNLTQYIGQVAPAFTLPKTIELDAINEATSNQGVDIDGVLLKDGTVKASSILSSAGTLVSGFYPLTAQDNITAGTGGAIVVTNYLTTINTDAGGDAFTLANGVQIGQLKKILLVVDGGGNAVITPTSLSGGTTITMNDANDFVILIWNGTAWVCIENSGSTIA